MAAYFLCSHNFLQQPSETGRITGFLFILTRSGHLFLYLKREISILSVINDLLE